MNNYQTIETVTNKENIPTKLPVKSRIVNIKLKDKKFV